VIIILSQVEIPKINNDESPSMQKSATEEPKKEPKEQNELTEQQKSQILDAVNSAVEIGFIKKLDSENHEVYVDLLIWNASNIETKENFTISMALYCSFNSSFEGKWVDIYDYQSGKKLAKYSIWGFKVY